MALCDDSLFSRAVERVLPAAKIRELSEETGVVRRRRKLDTVLFVRTLVLGFGVTGGRSLSGFRRLLTAPRRHDDRPVVLPPTVHE